MLRRRICCFLSRGEGKEEAQPQRYTGRGIDTEIKLVMCEAKCLVWSRSSCLSEDVLGTSLALACKWNPDNP